MSTEPITCTRCRRESAPLEAAPLPGPSSEEIAAQVCPNCWAEWQKMGVMVINELCLNFMEPSAQQILEQHMREFLGLATSAGEAT